MKAWALTTFVAAVAVRPCSAAPAAAEWDLTGWSLARTRHFEIYSQDGSERANFTVQRFEELHAFFHQNRLLNFAPASEEKPPARVMEFSTQKQYAAVKIHPAADAYYSSTADRDYIVMPIFATNNFSVAAHEYAHFVLHSGGLKLPPWLNEGLAEVFSNITITSRRCELGGAIPARVETLRRSSWMPASELFAPNAAARENRAGAAVFYAESWALTDMLIAAPEYAPRFGELVDLLNSGETTPRALAKVYAKPPEQILTDARQWLRHGGSPRRKLSPLAPETFPVETSPLREQQVKALMADLLMTNGDWDRAHAIYQELLRQSPNNPELLASLGTVALRKGERREALEYWRKAMDAGLNNAALLYRYALLADRVDLDSRQVEQALIRAIALRPNFDDARFKLALLKSNAGDYVAATNQLQAMTDVPPGRAYGYWTALAYALEELGRRDEAEAAADHANRFAATAEEHAHAVRLAYLAQTDVGVQFTRDPDGKLQLVTTRVPHGAPGINPFIEAEDHIRIASGHLHEVQCSDGRLTGFLVKSSQGTLTLLVPEPEHVLIRKGPSEFTCGAQTPVAVKVEYATTPNPDRGLLRGMEF